MRLYVDDEREAPKGWTLAKDVETAIRILATSPEMITDISLDHDGGTFSFEPVAYFIGEKAKGDVFFADDLEVTIHSANPIGRQKLTQILESYGIFPTY